MEKVITQDRHHVFSPNKSYRTQLEKELRSHRGFLIPVNRLVHVALHNAIEHPIKPSTDQTNVLLSEIGAFNPRKGRLYTLNIAIRLFNHFAEDSNIKVGAEQIADNLARQEHFIRTRDN